MIISWKSQQYLLKMGPKDSPLQVSTLSVEEHPDNDHDLVRAIPVPGLRLDFHGY